MSKIFSQLAVGSKVTPIEGAGNNLESNVTTILTNIIAVLGLAMPAKSKKAKKLSFMVLLASSLLHLPS